jgi:hypothetical protein
MDDKTMVRFKTLLFLLALAVQVPLVSAGVTYQVGGCLPKLTSFTTIMRALGATPVPDVVEVCPGVYSEQVIITNPVTLEGVSADNSTGATILVPSELQTANNGTLAPQVWVNTGGTVNLSNLTVDGEGYGNVLGSNVEFVGVLYLGNGTSGRMNHLVLEGQNGNGLGFGAWLDTGGDASITIENSFILGFDEAGIMAESSLKATISGNSLDGTYYTSTGSIAFALDGILINPGVNASISDNFVTGVSNDGIYLSSGSGGSVSKDTIQSVSVNGLPESVGIDVETDDVSVTSNTIREVGTGILVDSATAPVTGNTIVYPGAGIDFNCIAGKNVHSNTMLGGGLKNVPTAAVSTNTYYDVSQIRIGGC